MKIDQDFFEFIGERSDVVQWLRFFETHLRPIEPLEIQLTLPPGQRVEDPNVLAKVEQFASSLSDLPQFGATTSIVDLISTTNQLLHGNQEDHATPGKTTAQNAELIELLNLNASDLLEHWISFDRKALRISVEASEQTILERGEALEAVKDRAQMILPRDWDVLLTGEYGIGYEWVRDVQTTQIRSFPTASLAVLLLMAWFFRSLRLALIALLPTVLPVVAILGAMGWLGMSLDVGRAMIAAIVIGIGVDDSIHILIEYQKQRADGESVASAIRSAILIPGRAVVTTSVALALGFATLMASPWQTISTFGFFVVIAIVGALATTLFLLPVLVMRLRGSGEDEMSNGAKGT